MANETPKLPKCKYGENCYRRNPDHLRQFRHPSESSPGEPSATGISLPSPELDPATTGSLFFDSRSENQPGYSTFSKNGGVLTSGAVEDTPEDAFAGCEWEIDDYDGEITASSEAEELVEETPSSTNTHQNKVSERADAVVLLILVGVPGSGKSTFCSKLMSNAAQPWTRICQDIIANGKRGTKLQCLRQAESALRRGRSVVIDRCNIDKKQREDFLKLASRLKVNCHAVVLNLPPRLCTERAANRVAHEGGVHAGNAGLIVNRVNRSRQLPSLDEGFFRISFCRTDVDVEKAVQEYRNLQPSELFEPGMIGVMNKSESRSLQDGRSDQHAASNPSDNKASPGSKEDLAGVPDAMGKQQVSHDSGGEVATGSTGKRSPVDNQQPAANMLAFPSISTADFQFDHGKAATVLVEAISDFHLKNPHTGLKLVLVDLSSKSHMLSLVKRKASDKGLDMNRFMTFVGDITKIRSSGGPPCNIIANAANWRLKPGGGGVNAAIYKAAGPEFEQATKKVAATLRPGTSIIVPVPASSVLRNEEGVTHVIHVLGPNMNPQRPNYLADDYTEGCKILRSAYASLFENFASVAQVKPVTIDNCKSRVETGNVSQKPKLNAFQVLMQASKRKGEVADTAMKREKGEKVRVVEDGIACLRGEQAEGSLNQLNGRATLTSEASLQASASSISKNKGDVEVQNNSSSQQVRKKVERRWDSWALALYKIALHPGDAPARNSVLEVTDFAVVMHDLYPKAKKHVLVVSRTQGLDGVEDVRQEHIAILERMHSLGKQYAETFLKDDSSLVFRLGYHSAPSMRQLHLHVISQDFDSACLKNKKHWNSFTSAFFRDSLDVISEVKTKGYVDNCGPSAEKMLDAELRCHRCRSVQPNIPRLKTHIYTCTRPLSNSNHFIAADCVDGS